MQKTMIYSLNAPVPPASEEGQDEPASHQRKLGLVLINSICHLAEA